MTIRIWLAALTYVAFAGVACNGEPSDVSGAGGQDAAGGRIGTGGEAAAGGNSGGAIETESGGEGGAGPSGGGPGAGGSSTAFEVDVHLASEEAATAPTTVGIVTWSTTLGAPTSAKIEFGLTTDYGMEAPVDVSAPDLRTLLLGMKPESTYHLRIVAQVDGDEIVSEDLTLETGAAPEQLAQSVDLEVLSAEEREPGFIVMSHWQGACAGMVFIVDQDGDVVWWYDSQVEDGIGRAAISADGHDLWMVNGAPSLNGPVWRVGMDGLNKQEYGSVLASHDIVAVEGDAVAFVGLLKASEMDRAGQETTILPPLEPTAGLPHCNAIAYNHALGMYAVSNRQEDVYLFPRTGATPENIVNLTSIIGPNSTWGGSQHGVHLLSNNHLVMFANAEGGDLSTALEYDLDNGEEVWRYEGNEFSDNFGNAQRLPGGNTLVVYSNAGVIHEASPDQNKVMEIKATEFLGYASWRASLYGTVGDVAE